jgi:hypothetical protein
MFRRKKKEEEVEPVSSVAAPEAAPEASDGEFRDAYQVRVTGRHGLVLHVVSAVAV